MLSLFSAHLSASPSFAGSHTGSHLVSRFNEWKQTHTKSYATGQAEAAALAAFSHNDALIEEHNCTTPRS